MRRSDRIRAPSAQPLANNGGPYFGHATALRVNRGLRFTRFGERVSARSRGRSAALRGLDSRSVELDAHFSTKEVEKDRDALLVSHGFE